MDSQDLRNLYEAYFSVSEATGRDEMLAANIARAKAARTSSTTPKPTTPTTTSSTTPKPTGPVAQTPKPTGPVAQTPKPTGPVAQTPKPTGGLLGTLDKTVRDVAGRVGGEIGAQQGRQRYGNILGIPERIGRNRGTQQGQQMYDKAKQTVGGLLKQDYEPDAFDVILEYLVAEGYADTNANALVIMANMSEDWRQSILEYSGGGGAAPNAPNVAVKAVDKLGSMFSKVTSQKPAKKQTPDGFNPHQKFN